MDRDLFRRLAQAAAADPAAAYRAAGFTSSLRPEGDNLRGICPFHQEKKGSFVIAGPNKGDKAGLWHCFGCNTGGDIVEFYLRVTGQHLSEPLVNELAQKLGVKEAPPPPKKGKANSPGERQTFTIWSADGKPLAEHVRIDLPNGSKKFEWWSRGKPGLGGTRVTSLPLYGTECLSLWEQTDPIVIAEGEKAADALVKAGVPALGTTCGAAATPEDPVLESLRGRQVVLWPDKDDPGEEHMVNIASALERLRIEVRILTWPDAPKGGDAWDFLANGGDAEKVALLIAAAQTPEEYQVAKYAPTGPYSDFEAISGLVRATEWTWFPWLPDGGLTILGGDTESGKTFIALCVVRAVTTGGRFPAPDPEQARVYPSPAPILWVDAEARHSETARRGRGMGIDLRMMKHVPDQLGARPFNDPEGLRILRAVALRERVKLIVIDSLSAAYSGDENDSRMRLDLAALAGVAQDIRIPVLTIHHIYKPRLTDTHEFDVHKLRGSSAISQVAVSIWGIDRPDPEIRTRRLQLAKASYVADVQRPSPIGFDLDYDCQVVFCEAPSTPVKELVSQRAVILWKELVAEGPVTFEDVLQKARLLHISEIAMRGAAANAGVRSFKLGKAWWWCQRSAMPGSVKP